MTDIMEARRAKFEAWFESMNHYRPEIGYGQCGHYYLNQRVDDAWNAYNAALDSLCVEMPEPFKCDDGYPSDDWLESNAQTRAIGYCREAIHAAGVKTK